ncbi:MAG TPA: thiamine phosphate synthase [Gemmatimonadales bacterium]|nr:thiamine phosphate synthase [Gemmatimonadales bacterium]
MRPLPRVHAITDADVLALPDLGARAAAILSLGPAVALHVRDRAATTADLTAAAARFEALARPPEAAVFVNGRADLAQALGAQGLQLGEHDIAIADARRIFPRGWIGRSVHSLPAAQHAIADGADYLMVGSVFDTGTHPGRAPAGVELVRRVAALGRPVIAIGGITVERAAEVRAAGAWGVAAIRALWHAADPAAAARALAGPWLEAA